MQITDFLAYLPWILEGVALIYQFVKRLRRKLEEGPRSIESKKGFGIWTWVFFMPAMVLASVIAAALFFITRSIEASSTFLIFTVGCVVFVWLMPWTFPALGETVRDYLWRRVRDYLKTRFGD
jgi:hypothetical protein